MNLYDREDYKEAIAIYTRLIDDYNAKNPFIFYMRAKCYSNLGIKYLNKVREDLMRSETYLKKIHTPNGNIMRLKVHYTHGVVEVQQGADLERAVYHFNEFEKIVSILESKKETKRNMPEFDTFQENAAKYKM